MATFYTLRNRLLWMAALLFCTAVAYSQNYNFSIQGMLKDNQGEPLIGATVQVSAAGAGTVTDIDGKYSLSGAAKPGNYVVTFSYVGYSSRTETINLSSNNQQFTLDVTLGSDVLNMDEVVVVGSSVTASRRQLGNSVNSLKAENLVVANPQGLNSALQGKLPGAQVTQNSGDPAGGFSVRLRGASTINGSSEPLYIIDGVVISNSTANVTNTNVSAGSAQPGTNRLADINPNDIERIEVINGAAAAAIYGSRASNGVILITTKRGKSGKPQFTFSSSANINQLRERVYVNLRPEQFGSATQRLWPIAGTNPTTGALTVGANLSSEKVPVTRYDYQDQIFRTGMGTDQHLSVSGGSENSNYYGAISYLKNEGIIQNADFQRYSARLRYNQTVNSWASYSFGLNYSNSFSNEKPDGNVFWSPINAFNITNNIWDITKRDALGNLQAVEPTRINPLSAIEDFDINQEVNRAIADFQLKLLPFKGMTIDYIAGVDAFAQVGNIFIPPYPYAGVNPTFFNDGYASTANNNSFLMNHDINMSYRTKLSDFLESTTQAGYSTQFEKIQQSLTQGRGLAPFVQTVNGAGTILPTQSNIARLRIWGYYVQQTFGVNNRLFLTVAGRIDGASSFSPDNRNQFYPKVSGSYVLSSESFWKESGISKYISTLKLRASYGQAGNLTGIGAYDRFNTYLTNSFVGVNAINQAATLANPNVQPERQAETEAGVDLSLFNDRIGVSATYYEQEIEDLLLRRVLAASSGGTAITTNVGQMSNTGFELLLTGTPVRKAKFSWDVMLNFSRNRNVVSGLGQSELQIPTVTGAPISVVEGEPLAVFYGTYFARNPDGSLLLTAAGLPQVERGNIVTGEIGRDANGQPVGTALRRKIGDPNPDYMLGFSSTFRIGKHLSINFLIESVQGVDVFDADKRTRQGVGLGRLSEQELTGELPRGYINAIYPIEEWRMEDGSFTKIREVAISYSIPELAGGALRNTTITLGGRNLYSFDNFFSYDPETNAGGQSNVMRGVNFGNVPIPRVYTLGLRTNF